MRKYTKERNTKISQTMRELFKSGKLTSWSKGLERIKVDKNKLFELYVTKRFPTRKTAKLLDVTLSLVAKRLHKYGWMRTESEGMMGHEVSESQREKRRIPIDKNKLYQLYCIEGYSTSDLEKVFNADSSTIGNRLKKYGWMRINKEAHNQPKYTKKLVKANLGKKASKETKEKSSLAHKGLNAREKHPMWKGGITPLNKVIRHSDEYKQWKNFIFDRDNYICQICGERGGKLRANHIKRFADCPELRFEKNNGIVICDNCDYKLVMGHEKKWESYFNFNLETRGIIESEFIPKMLGLEGGHSYDSR